MDMLKCKVEQIDIHIIKILHSYLESIEIVMPGVGLDIQCLAESLGLKTIHILKEVVLDLLYHLKDLITLVA